MITITAGEVTQYQDIDSGDTLQNVPWTITEGEGKKAVELLSGNQSFPLTASAEEVTEFLTRRLEVYKDDSARYEGAKEHQENLDHAAGVAEEISGVTIKDE